MEVSFEIKVKLSPLVQHFNLWLRFGYSIFKVKVHNEGDIGFRNKGFFKCTGGLTRWGVKFKPHTLPSFSYVGILQIYK
jgi:hypothetical protein